MKRVVVIGLDAAEITLIEGWARQGFLPHIKALLEEGTSGRLQSTAEMLSGSVWPSLCSGTLPGRHGMSYYLQTSPRQQGAREVNPSHYQQPPFWKILDAAGKRCVILDVPKSYPLSDVDGVQIFNWGTYEKHSLTQSIPAWRLDDLVGRIGHHPLEKEIKVPTRSRDYHRLLQKLLTGVSLKGRAVDYLLAAESCDFLFVVFNETHVAGHYFWRFSERPSSDPDNRGEESGGALRQIYAAVDDAIGQILKGLDHDTMVVVVSAHGMGGNSLGYHLLPQVLRRLGLLVMRGQAWTERDWLKKARDLVPSRLRQSVSRHLPRIFRHYLSSRWASADIDWGKTRVFCLPSDLQGYLRINLKGREPRGIVEPGLEYEELCAKLTTELGGLTDPSSGRPVVGRIFKSDETFVGPYRHHLPDLVVSWANSRGITEVWSPDTGLVSETSPDARSGNHLPAGFFIMTGPGISRGSVREARHICDIAPTMLAFFGLTPPEHMDGNVWTEATNLPVDKRGA